MLRHSLLSAAAGGMLAGATAPAEPAYLGGPGDAALPETVISAGRLGDESLQSVPLSVTVVDLERLNRQGLTSLSDLGREVPGLSVAALGAGQNSITVRGIGSLGVPDPSNVEDQPLVSVYLDEVPISLAGATPDIRVFDLERVEFIRGPQGTLYGAGAMAGTLRYITQKPNAEASMATIESSVGTTEKAAGSYSVRSMVNEPLFPGALALRVSAYAGRDGGYIDNIGTGEHNANRQDSTQVRAALRFDDGRPLTLDGSYWYGDIRQGGHDDALSGLQPFQFDDNTPESYRDRLWIAGAGASYRAPGLSVIFSTSYIERSIANLAGFQYGDQYYFGLPATTRSSVIIDNHLYDVSQELRIASRGTGSWRGQAGVFVEHQRRTERIDIPTPGLDSAFHINSLDYGAFQPDDQYSGIQSPVTRQAALFGEVTYSPAGPWDLTAGLRQFVWRQSFSLYAGGLTGASSPGHPETASRDAAEHGTNPRLNVAYRQSPDLMVFAEAARGFRYGGINQPVPGTLCGAALAAEGLAQAPTTYGPDHLWTYSLGEKSAFAEKRVVLNATAFYTLWTGVQTRHDLSCGYYFQQNSGDVRSRGLELETRIQATAALRLGFSASYTDAVANGPIRNLDAPNGARVPYFPRAIATLDATYAIPLPSGSLLLQADDEFRSREGTEFVTTGTLFRQLPSTRVLNAAGTWILGNTEWTLFARNLTNTPILSAIHPNGYAPFQPGDIVYLQRPRTLGLKVKVSFGPSAR